LSVHAAAELLLATVELLDGGGEELEVADGAALEDAEDVATEDADDDVPCATDGDTVIVMAAGSLAVPAALYARTRIVWLPGVAFHV
jgi:hypothetical protein